MAPTDGAILLLPIARAIRSLSLTRVLQQLLARSSHGPASFRHRSQTICRWFLTETTLPNESRAQCGTQTVKKVLSGKMAPANKPEFHSFSLLTGREQQQPSKMVFSSTIFLFLFLPITLAGYFVCRGVFFRNIFLLIASLVFYSWGEAGYVAVLLVSIFINYLFGLKIARHDDHRRKVYLFLAVSANLVILSYYKYANFLTDNFNSLLGFTGSPTIDYDPVHLPIGISFFTFQAISYVVDVYRRVAPAQKRFLEVAVYISLFPQLIAGPIVRYGHIAAQITSRTVTLDNAAAGIRRFVMGLAKKMLIANVLGEIADQIFATPTNEISMAVAWFGVLCYALQIYFDFSGYSDMAIGLGRVFGFRFPENFNYPYISQSLQEFWRRWHMSLSSWFRDCVYIPLGGNRKSATRTYLNLVIVFFLCGLWHGASWTFVIWGLFHGAFLVLERLGLNNMLARMPVIIRHAYLILVILVSWVFFRSETLHQALAYLSVMFGATTADRLTASLSFYLNNKVLLASFFGLVLCAPVYRWIKDSLSKTENITFAHATLIGANTLTVGLLILSIIAVAGDTYNPFIYFRF